MIRLRMLLDCCWILADLVMDLCGWIVGWFFRSLVDSRRCIRIVWLMVAGLLLDVCWICSDLVMDLCCWIVG